MFRNCFLPLIVVIITMAAGRAAVADSAPASAPASSAPDPKQLMQEALDGITAAPQLLIEAQEQDDMTPAIASTDSLVTAVYTGTQYRIRRPGQAALKITATGSNASYEELFDGTRCTVTFQPSGRIFWWTPNSPTADWVLAHNYVLITTLDSPLRDILPKSGQDHLVRQATDWKYLGTGAMDNGLILDRIGFHDSAGRTWEVWIGRDKPLRIERMILTYVEKTGGAEMGKQGDVTRQVDYDDNVRDEWIFSKWDAKPVFTDGEFKFTPIGGRMREDKYTDPPQLLPGALAPNFALPDMNGKAVQLSDRRGKIVVLDFWNTSCGYCIQDMPTLRDVVAKYQNKDVELLTICNDDAATTAKLVADKGWQSLPVVLDTDSKVGKDYKVSGYPTLLVIGRDGVVTAVEDGGPKSYGQDLTDMLDDAVAAKNSSPK